MEKSYFVIIKKGISEKDVVTLAHLLGMYNLRQYFGYVEIWLTTDEKIEKLCQILKILDVDFSLAKQKDYSLSE